MGSWHVHDSTSTGGFGDPLDGDKPGLVTGSWDAFDSTEVFWMGVAGMSSWVA